VADTSQIQSIRDLFAGGGPWAILLGGVLTFLRFGPRMVRTTIKEWVGEQDTRERELQAREKEQDAWRDLEIARLRGEVVKEHQQREKNADLMRAWYWRYVELHLNHGGKMQDVPAIESITGVPPPD
jgi:hypothetical protein